MDTLTQIPAELQPYQIALVAPHLAPGRLWEAVEPFIKAALTRGHALNLSLPTDILSHTLLGHNQLWVAYRGNEIDAAVITRIIDWDRSRSLFIPIVGGRNMRGWIGPMMTELEKYARANGCSRMHGESRKGWARLCGFNITGVTTELVL